jgi:hypothetical protein
MTHFQRHECETKTAKSGEETLEKMFQNETMIRGSGKRGEGGSAFSYTNLTK